MNTQHPQSLPTSHPGTTSRPHPPTLIYRLVLLGMFVIFGLPGEALAEWQHTVLKHLGGPEGSSPRSSSSLVIGTDGRLYGTTPFGGASGYGTVFALNADGTDFTTLYSFDGNDRTRPFGGLTFGIDGRLYGTTMGSGDSDEYGIVFAINTEGTGFTTLHSFAGTDGSHPYIGLTTDANGRLYGTTLFGGVYGYGTVFALNPNGTEFVTLHSFAHSDGAAPYGRLTIGTDGRLYGTTVEGGNPSYGTVYAINPDGAGFTTLHFFAWNSGVYPFAGVTTGADGRLYGTTQQGGTTGYGVVYAINTDGTAFTTLHSFVDGSFYHGAWPYAGLTAGADGRLYGATQQGGGASRNGTIYVINTNGTEFITLHSFAGSDGRHPSTRLTAGADGRIYGTTQQGGAFDGGTLFVINDYILSVTITTPPSEFVQQVNQGVRFEGSYTPTAISGSYTAKWTFTSGMLADPIEVSGIVTGTNVSCIQAFPLPGVYAVTLTVTDPTGVSASTSIVSDDPDEDAFVVIYDPKGGCVTGGGWLQSPDGAFKLDPSQEGRANFSFNSKYKEGATVPHGNVEFQFKAGGLNFALSSGQWLVVAGSDAKFKGTGMINGLDGFGILLTTRDGGAARSDKLRIKIWDLETDEVIYDNQLGSTDDAPLDASTVLKGGNITVHRK